MEEEKVEVSIDQEIGRVLNEMANYDPTSEEYKKLDQILSGLYRLRIDEDKTYNERDIKLEELKFKREELEVAKELNQLKKEEILENAKLKREEIKESKKTRWFGIGETTLKVGAVFGMGVVGGVMQYTMHKEDNDLKEKGYIIKDSTRPSWIESMSSFFKKLM